jgi:DNA-binding MarR family transcriptional regulator
MKKYLHFIKQVQQMNDEQGLTRYEIALLDFSAHRHLSNQMITVGELVRLGDIASQATLRSAFKALIQKRLLTTNYHHEDGRVKQVTLTKLAIERYKNLDRAISGLL